MLSYAHQSKILNCYMPTIIRASITSHTTHRTRDVQLEPRLLRAGRDRLRGARLRRLLHYLPAAMPYSCQYRPAIKVALRMAVPSKNNVTQSTSTACCEMAL